MATLQPTTSPALPIERLERVEGWGRAVAGMAYVYRPSTPAGVEQVLSLARRSGRSVGLRGAGRSYADAAINSENIVLDLSRMNRILAWDPASGVIAVEPGVTIQQLWEYALEDGWWPPVVPGTMFPTLGGCAATNIHGKNAWKAGPIGEHILEFEAVLANGERATCSREQNADLFHALISGFGMLGVFTRITLQLKRVYSGYLRVEALPTPNLPAMFRAFEERLDTADYLVGWVDGTAGGGGLGRGQLHRANYLPPGADPFPAQSLQVGHQTLPDTFFGVVPKSILWRFMRPFMNNAGTRLVNTGKYLSGALQGRSEHLQTFAAFNFLLDYVPNWKLSYGPGGLHQYQMFIPAAEAPAAFAETLRRSQKAGLPTYLAVFKRHRPDDFLISHGLEGYSLAMDFKVTRGNRPGLARLFAELDRIVLDTGGRFYFAKDGALHADTAAAFLGEPTLARFSALKRRCDPDNLQQTDLSRRLFEFGGGETGRQVDRETGRQVDR